MSGGRDFWSRRRAAVAAEAALETAPEAVPDTRDDAEILAELDLPDPDTLQPGDDVTGFMMRAVPEHLRRRALRRLWRLNPVLANIDGLVDYGEDYTDSATVIENMQTAYRVGKGMLAHIEEMARQAEAEENAEPAEAETLAPDPEEAAEAEPEDAVPEDGAPATEAAAVPAEASTTLVSHAPRRMRFAFDAPAAKLDATTGTS